MGDGIFSWPDFLTWEQASRDTIDFKRCYVDVAGDLVAGLVLSQIIYWFLPNRNGNLKVQVHKDGHVWLVKRRSEWWEECRVNPKQADRALDILSQPYPPEAPFRGALVEAKVFKFGSETATHIRLLPEELLSALNKVLDQQNGPEIPMNSGNSPNGNSRETQANSGNSPNGNSGIPQMGIPSYTETTLIDYSNRFESNLEKVEEVSASPGIPEEVPVAEESAAESDDPFSLPLPSVPVSSLRLSVPPSRVPVNEAVGYDRGTSVPSSFPRTVRGEGNGSRAPYGLRDEEWREILHIVHDGGIGIRNKLKSAKENEQAELLQRIRQALQHLQEFELPEGITPAQRFFAIVNGRYNPPGSSNGSLEAAPAAKVPLMFCTMCHAQYPGDTVHECPKDPKTEVQP